MLGTAFVVFDAAAVDAAALVAWGGAEVWPEIFTAGGRAGCLWRAANSGVGRVDGVWDADLGLRTGEC